MPKTQPQAAVVKASEAKIKKALTHAAGYMPDAAKALGMHPRTLQLRVINSPELKKFHATLRTELLEAAEVNLFGMVVDGDWSATRFVLERLAREKWGPVNKVVLDVEQPPPIGEDPDAD